MSLCSWYGPTLDTCDVYCEWPCLQFNLYDIPTSRSSCVYGITLYPLSLSRQHFCSLVEWQILNQYFSVAVEDICLTTVHLISTSWNRILFHLILSEIWHCFLYFTCASKSCLIQTKLSLSVLTAWFTLKLALNRRTRCEPHILSSS